MSILLLEFQQAFAERLDYVALRFGDLDQVERELIVAGAFGPYLLVVENQFTQPDGV